MNRGRGWPLTAMRLAYVALGTGTCIAGPLVLAGGDPVLAVLVEFAGVLAITAAAWVTSEHRGRGALASIGIVVGPLPAAGFALLIGSVLAAFGRWPFAIVAAGVIGLCVAVAALMWRSSRRPWEDAQLESR
jgi:undecaprenyl pyrophosphate phosphatase UppP